MKDHHPRFQFLLHRSGHGGVNAHSQARNLRERLVVFLGGGEGGDHGAVCRGEFTHRGSVCVGRRREMKWGWGKNKMNLLGTPHPMFSIHE